MSVRLQDLSKRMSSANLQLTCPPPSLSPLLGPQAIPRYVLTFAIGPCVPPTPFPVAAPPLLPATQAATAAAAGPAGRGRGRAGRGGGGGAGGHGSAGRGRGGGAKRARRGQGRQASPRLADSEDGLVDSSESADGSESEDYLPPGQGKRRDYGRW
jgi:hypothetical protein